LQNQAAAAANLKYYFKTFSGSLTPSLFHSSSVLVSLSSYGDCSGGADEAKRESGKQLMIYATLGFVLIIIFWGVINFVVSSIGLENENIDPLIPKVKTI
jgi:hypothetical protein